MKIATILIALTAAFLNLGVAAAAAEKAVQAEVELVETVTVDSNMVRLGDIFTNTGDKAGIAIAYAPPAGKQALFDANWLYRVARSYRLNWRPFSPQIQVVVERRGVVIPREEIEDRILQALIEKGVAPNMQVVLSNRMMRIHVPGSADARVEVEDVAYQPGTGRFNAVIAAFSNSGPRYRTRVSGRLYRVLEVPVLARRHATGEVIKKGSVKWIKVRANRVQRDVVINLTGLVGKSGRRSLAADQPIRASEVRRPILVPRNSLVTIVLQTPLMRLTAQGRALEEGSRGDTIRINNSRSKKVVEAVVDGPGRVSVQLPSFVAMK